MPTEETTNTTSTTPPAGTPIQTFESQQVQNPSLPTGTEVNPVLQTVQNNELMNNSGQYNIGNTTPKPAGEVTAGQVNPNDVTQNFNTAAGQYQATLGNNAAQGTAAQGTVNAPTDTVKGQLTQLYSETADGQTPLWAKGAVRSVEEAMAARGLGASSISAQAMTAAIQNSAIQIAAADAQTYFQMNLANLSNEQQMAMENVKNRQQGLLSDQAADNASKQFNAASQQQVQQYLTSLIASIKSQNADRAQAAQQFNVTEADKVNQFYDTLAYNRDQFNAQMQYAIDQSNVQWRRTVNTQNTATANAANQINAQNKFNISQTALNNLWQQFRDEANYAFTASENQKNRDTNMAIAANNQSFALSLQEGQQKSNKTSQLYSMLGGLAGSIFA